MNQTLLYEAILLSGYLAIILAILSWKDQHVRGMKSLATLSIALAIWAIGYSAELRAITLPDKLVWIHIKYIGILLAPSLLLVFTLFYTGMEHRILQNNLVMLLLIEPILVYLALLTNNSHHLFYTHLSLNPPQTITTLNMTYGIVYKLNLYYSYLLSTFSYLLLLKQRRKTPQRYRGQISWLLLGFAIPWVGNIAFQFRPPFLHNIDPTPILYLFSVIISIFALHLSDFSFEPITWSAIINAFDDVIIVLNQHGHITNLNPAAEIRLGLDKKQCVGRPATEGFPASLKQYVQPLAQTHTRVTYKHRAVSRAYELSLIPLHDKKQRTNGWVLTLHDITHLANIEATLQRRNLELAKIDDLIASINSNLALDDVLQSCIDAVLDLYPEPYKITIQLLEKDGSAYTVAGTEHVDGTRQRIHFAPGEGILGAAIREQKLINVADVFHDPRYIPGPTSPDYHSLMVIPMIAKGETVGTLSINSPKVGAFCEHDEQLLQRLSNHAAIAIINARLYEQAQREILVRELAEQAAKASAEQYRLLFESTTNGIFISQHVSTQEIRSGQFIDVNARACELLGYTREELLQLGAADITAEESMATLQEHRLTLYAHNRARSRFLLRTKTGEKLPFEVHSSLLNIQDTPTILSIVWDISRHEKMEALQRQRIADLEEYNAELDAFAHTVSHDLKNPLSAIIGFSQMLETRGDTLPPDKLTYYARFISQGARKMQLIIEGLIALAQSKTLQDVDAKPLINMEQIIREAWERLAVLDKYEEAELTIMDSMPAAIGYAPWVEEVWSNYLSNALKYGGEPPIIKCGSSVQADGIIRFWVQDNGRGLSEEEQARLFVPFVRLRSQGIKGHGLGLSIVQRIVRRLGGTVGVESDGEHGSTFYFTLPAAEAERDQ